MNEFTSNPLPLKRQCLLAFGSKINTSKGIRKGSCSHYMIGSAQRETPSRTNMKTKIDPPAQSEDSRADEPKPRRDRRPRCRLDKQDPDALSGRSAGQPAENSSWRSRLPAELRNASREELLALSDRNLCGSTGVSDPDLAKRILGQSILMRTFGEPDGCNLGKPDVEAFASLGGFAPNNILESMLAVQMSGVHEAALAFLKAAGEPGRRLVSGERQVTAGLKPRRLP